MPTSHKAVRPVVERRPKSDCSFTFRIVTKPFHYYPRHRLRRNHWYDHGWLYWLIPSSIADRQACATSLHLDHGVVTLFKNSTSGIRIPHFWVYTGWLVIGRLWLTFGTSHSADFDANISLEAFAKFSLEHQLGPRANWHICQGRNLGNLYSSDSTFLATFGNTKQDSVVSERNRSGLDYSGSQWMDG